MMKGLLYKAMSKYKDRLREVNVIVSVISAHGLILLSDECNHI